MQSIRVTRTPMYKPISTSSMITLKNVTIQANFKRNIKVNFCLQKKVWSNITASDLLFLKTSGNCVICNIIFFKATTITTFTIITLLI